MNLADWFDPVDEQLLNNLATSDTWEKSITIHKGRFPSWRRKHLAVFGVDTLSFFSEKHHEKTPADYVRQKLYPLKKGRGAYQIVDLGNLIVGDTIEDTHQRLIQVCEILYEHQVIPIILGGSHSLDYAQFRAYESQGKLISMVSIDAKIDVEEPQKNPVAHTHTKQILSHKPNFLFNYNHLAHQNYLNSSQALDTLEQLYFEAYSIGQIRKDLQEVEPIMRYADMLSFDLSAVKMEYAPAQIQAQLMGLSAEEACQLCWFGGLSEKLTSFGIYEFCPAYDERQKTASLIATMIWYFVEGYYDRVKLKDFDSNAFMKYLVSALDNSNHINMVFYKHKVTQKWWMEVPYPSELSSAQESIIIPCSYKDYQTANKGEVPDRWISIYAKLV